MIVYKDMTFCDYWRTCKDGSGCGRALTGRVEHDAEEFGLPIEQFAVKPKCYDYKEMGNDR